MKTKSWVAILGTLLAILIWISVVSMGGEEATRAKILSNGKTVRIVDLTVDQQFTVETEDGYNIITVQDGKIAVTEANCPDHYCMDRGFQNSGAQIVCLPNRLVIEFLGEQDADAALG